MPEVCVWGIIETLWLSIQSLNMLKALALALDTQPIAIIKHVKSAEAQEPKKLCLINVYRNKSEKYSKNQ